MAKEEEKEVEKKETPKVQSVKKPKKELKTFNLKDDYPPKKKGDPIKLSKEGELYLKSKNLI